MSTSVTFYSSYERTNPYLKDFAERVNALRYRYYASELLSRLVRTPDFDLDKAVRKAVVICKLAGIPVNEHFTAIYRSEKTVLIRDWKFSDLACGFVIISYNANSDETREIQEALIRYMGL